MNLKWNQSWIFIGRTYAEDETSIHWPPDTKSRLIGKDPDAGKNWRQEEKGMTQDEMARWHHPLNGHEFEQALGVGMDREAWHAAVLGVTKSWTWLRDWTDTHFSEISVCIYRESTPCVYALPYFHYSHTLTVHNSSDTQSNGKKNPYFLFTYIHNTSTRGA